MITMRLFAEEKRTGTIELLATSPIRDTEMILGKWLAAVLGRHLLCDARFFCIVFDGTLNRIPAVEVVS
jgi:hypothetical protein